MRLITVFAIFTCAMLVSSLEINIFQKEKPEEKSGIKKIVDKVAGVFKPEPPKEETFREKVDAKFTNLWETLTRAKKDKVKTEDESTRQKWIEAFKFKSVWDTLSKLKKAKNVTEEVKNKQWYEIFKFWVKKDQEEPKKEKKEKEEKKDKKEQPEIEKRWFEAFKFGNMWDSIRESVTPGSDRVNERSANLTNERIKAAIKKKDHDGIKLIMNDTGDFELPKKDFPPEIKTIKSNDTSIMNCTKALTPALPGLMKFGLNSAIGRLPSAVSHLFDVLKLIPDISRKCLGQEIKLQGNEPDTAMCKKDVVELTDLTIDLAKHPLHVISNYRRLKRMIYLVPGTIGHCTTAFV